MILPDKQPLRNGNEKVPTELTSVAVGSPYATTVSSTNEHALGVGGLRYEMVGLTSEALSGIRQSLYKRRRQDPGRWKCRWWRPEIRIADGAELDWATAPRMGVHWRRRAFGAPEAEWRGGGGRVGAVL